jgi:hypothetical protein
MTSAEYLTGRPVHLSSSQQMQVEVIDCLTTIGSGIDDEAKTVVETLLLCNFVRRGEELTEKFGVARGGVCERSNVLPGDDQDMHRGLWIDVGKREHVLILIEMRDWDRAGGNLAEEAVSGCSHVRMLNLRGYFLKYFGSISGVQGL